MSNVKFRDMIVLRNPKCHSFCLAVVFVVVLRLGLFIRFFFDECTRVRLGLVLIVMPSGIVSLSIGSPCLMETL
jgi:predicted Na+-dependent transporter